MKDIWDLLPKLPMWRQREVDYGHISKMRSTD